MILKIRNLLVSGVLVFLFTACGLTASQKNAVTHFSKASSAFGESSSTEILQIRPKVIAVNTSILKIDPSQVDKENLAGAFSIEMISARVKAVDAIKNYGDLMLALVEDTQEQELKNASDRFTQSIQGLDQNDGLTSEELDAIGKAAIAVGGLIVEHKKAESLKEIVPIAHKQIVKIGELLKQEFKTNGILDLNIFANKLKDELAVESILDNCKNEQVACPLAAEANKKVQELVKWAENVFPLIERASDKMITAHNSLNESLKNDDSNLEDIKSFSNSIQELLLITNILSEN